MGPDLPGRRFGFRLDQKRVPVCFFNAFLSPEPGYHCVNPGYHFAGKSYNKPPNTASLGRQPVRNPNSAAARAIADIDAGIDT
jgi:hypothetical protein